ncbi:hypothetical protein SUGI_0386750 [Cryptomeria japonica]|uniref:NDR1/HIN1-like protein 3 n=1 Tax=Cryptomeria japonica TaxID=3369 RepID=UPI002408B975|nr:NDR1/HIN1-like protein 3 [Cryptomeria japonica]GLJ21144.1 hypothetical protein SUGI_0386750 [Cryptomeria japonica]
MADSNKKPPSMYKEVVERFRNPRRKRDRIISCLCATFFGLLVFAAIFILITWLVLQPHRPRYYVDYGSVSLLNVEGKILNTKMTFNVTSRNPNKRIGIYYDKMEGYVYYGDQRIAGAYIAPFYQGHKTTTIIKPILTGHYVLLKDDLSKDLVMEHTSGAVDLRLKLYAKLRFKVGSWKSRHYHMRVKCDVWMKVSDNNGGTFSPKRCNVYF